MVKSEDLHFYLKKYWGHDDFRPLQEEIIRSVLDNHDTLALLPTGGGKSICFQIPGLIIGGTCLVISPLIALMNDQVQNLKNKGISAASITSAMTLKEIEIALNNAALGHIQFLYVSPERLENKTFRQQLSYLPIGLIAVDEAHCISQWGYDFRPSYLNIAELRTFFPNIKIIAVTASATKEVVEDIQKKLEFKSRQVFRQSFERKNIRYVVQQDENKYNRILKIIKNIGGSGIIYVRNRKKTEEISKWLIQNNYSSTFYHAGIKSNEREEIQNKWISNQSQIMVATNAFGMGIDKPDVRFVIHVDLPESLEAYFQEAGRAGRDGRIAYAILLCNATDVFALQEQYKEKMPETDSIKKCYQAIFNFYQIPVESGEGVSVNFNIDDVAKNYQLKPITIYNSIKCLEREGYLSLLDSGYEPSKVMMAMNKEDLYNFQIKYPKYEPLIKVLLRSYGGLFEQYISIKEKEVAYRAKISETELYNQLENLNKQGVLFFIPQTTLPKLIFLHNRLNLKFDSIKFIYYPVLKEKALARINSVIQYLNETQICRNRLLLAYFNETHFEDCEYCDVCIEKHKIHLSEENIQKEIFELLKNQKLTFEEIISKLSHLNSKSLSVVLNKMIDDEILLMNTKKEIGLEK